MTPVWTQQMEHLNNHPAEAQTDAPVVLSPVPAAQKHCESDESVYQVTREVAESDRDPDAPYVLGENRNKAPRIWTA